jgi:hypothetical protein
MNEELIKSVADRVLRRLGAEPVRSAPEQAPAASSAIDYFAPWTGEAYPANPGAPPEHASQDLFNIGEAAERSAVVRELVDFLEAEKCSIEKDKPCDHCGSCRTLGF